MPIYVEFSSQGLGFYCGCSFSFTCMAEMASSSFSSTTRILELRKEYLLLNSFISLRLSKLLLISRGDLEIILY